VDNLEIHNEAVRESKKAVKEIQDEYVKHNPDNPHKEPYYCGFAWVKIRPATTSFAKTLKKEGIVDYVSYNGGYDIYNPADYGGQSMDFKEAGAEAYAKVLNSYGIRAMALSRAD
tara:strand:- start:675 stop:1019 length:345 start_codon:yes stop_codon:yes gene_type:complete